MTIETDGLGDEPDFDSVFARDDDVTDGHDSEADTVASETAQPRDASGRFTSVHETPVDEPAQPEPEAKPQDQQQAQADPQQSTTPSQSQDRMIPLTELRSERQKRQDAERQLAELRGQVAAFERMQQSSRPQAQHQQQQPEAPDPYSDPQGWANHLQETMRAEYEEREVRSRSAMSEALMRSQTTDYDEVLSVFMAAAQGNPQLVVALRSDPMPARYAYETGKRMMALQKIGTDPNAYEQRIREEERQKVLAELKAGGAGGVGGQPKPVFPGSLATATHTGRQGAHLDPQAAADSVFAR